MRLDRRRALSLLAMGVAAPASAETAADYRGAARFEHGVAAGDPLTDRIVLWTRATPESGRSTIVPVVWEVARDPSFRRIVARGAAHAGPDRDHCVKVDAAGLKPGIEYHYRFRSGAAVSPVGRAKTLPAGVTEDVVLAVTTCALLPAGYFNAYADIARAERLDAVIELGDYIYEYGAGEGDYGMEIGRRLGRIPEPAHDLVTLADYRTRYAQYRRDSDLQAAHARAAWICVWDDHETADDSWTGGANNHHPDEGPWIDREAAALRAYFEWMPIRDPVPGQAFEAINRSFQFGDLASLIMLETRLMARAYQLEPDRKGDIPKAVYTPGPKGSRVLVTDAAKAQALLADVRAGKPLPSPYVLGPDMEAVLARINAPDRQMLGARQEQWLAEEMAASVRAGRPWQVLGNGTVMAKCLNPNVYALLGEAAVDGLIAKAPKASQSYARSTADQFRYPLPYDLDCWNGYPAARERVYQAVISAGPKANTILLSGDSHAFWANELHDEAGLRAAVEFGSSSVTSPSLGDEAGGVQLGAAFTAQNKEVKFCDQLAKGYVRLTLTRSAAKAEIVSVPCLSKAFEAKAIAVFRVRPTDSLGAGPLEKI